MQKATLALLIGGLLPAVLFGASGVVQKMSARSGIATGPFLVVVGLVVTLVGVGTTLAQQETTPSRASTAYAALYGLLWAAGIGCIALALGRYDASISQLVPLYNMNTLVAVAGGLVLLSEWHEVRAGQLALAAVLTIAGGILAAGAAK